MSESRFEDVVAEVRDSIDPDPDERERLRATATDVVARARTAIDRLPVEADVVQVGSTARGTWVSGDRDIDVFVRFPPDLDREKLESYGLQVGHEVLPDGHEEYAEHPYVKGPYDGFDVDLVPCYRLDDATEIRSAVDRTPFHNAFLEDALDEELAADVRVCKALFKSIGVYGSNLRTEGFSGYLTELLVLAYGGFRPLIEAAADWHPHVRLDPGDTGSDASFDDSLVVIDPTDPARNVAAVLSAENLARFQHYAREFLADPRTDLFDQSDPEPLSADEVIAHVDRRGTTPVAVRFPTPDVVDDQLYPQLRKTLSGITDELGRRGFEVLRATTFANDDAVLFMEFSVVELPAVERHEGPPVHVEAHATGFYEKYANHEDTYGPFIDGDRYVVERERETPSVVEFLRSDHVFNVGVGPDVAAVLRNGYDVLVGDDVADLSEDFGVMLARYFHPRP